LKTITYNIALGVTIAIAVGLAIFAEKNRRDANRQADLVSAPRIVAQAELVRAQSPELAHRAALIALEAYARAQTLEADALLRRSVVLLPHSPAMVTHDKPLFAVTIDHQKRLIYGGTDGIVRIRKLWDSQVQLKLAHKYPVHGITTSPDGLWIATKEYNPRKIRLWNAANGKQHHVLQHAKTVTGMKFSRTGEQIVTYGSDIPAGVWSVASGNLQFQTDPDVGIADAGFGRQGRWLVTAGRDSRVRIWEFATGKKIAEYQHDASKCAISADGQIVASGDRDGSVELRATTGAGKPQRYKIESRVKMLSFTPDKRLIAVGPRSVHLWSLESGSSVVIDVDPLVAVKYSAAANRVATAAANGLVQIWDAETGHEIARLLHDDWVKDIAFDTSGRWLASVTRNGSVCVWDLGTIGIFRHDGAVNDVVFSVDGSRLISAGRDGTTRVWNTRTSRELKRLQHQAPVWAVVASPDGKWFAGGDADGMARIWSTADYEERARLVHVGAFVLFDVIALAVSPDSSILASGAKDGRARLWEVAYGLPREPLDNHNNVFAVTFSPDGKRLATGAGSKARIWDVKTLTEIRVLDHKSFVFGVAFNPPGSILATGAGDGIVRLWDMETGDLIREMAHDASVRSVAFSPNGRYVASVGHDRTARIWASDTGVELNRILLDEAANAIAFGPDGRRLATGDQSGRIRIWPLHREDLIADVCARLPRQLSAAEVRRHLWGQKALHPCSD
jgi:WD40 repeat protein